MDPGLTVTLVSVAMFVGSFFLGFIPLLFTLSEKSLRYVSILGAGLLCGTALAITIPEGVGLLEDSWRASSSSSEALSAANASDGEASSTEGASPSRFHIGLALTFGFTVMFLIDRIGESFSIHDQRTHLSSNAHIMVTLGLVFHAAADGFTLGSAVATGQVTVQVIVFFAVILHKAPAAFGLVSFLMHSGLEKKHIQGHLLAFSAAAPILAISTFYILHAWGNSSLRQHLQATGLGMLFSAGTFLYVATVHVLPEISAGRSAHAGAERRRPFQGLAESITLIIGVFFPLFLALGLPDD